MTDNQRPRVREIDALSATVDQLHAELQDLSLQVGVLLFTSIILSLTVGVLLWQRRQPA